MSNHGICSETAVIQMVISMLITIYYSKLHVYYSKTMCGLFFWLCCYALEFPFEEVLH